MAARAGLAWRGAFHPLPEDGVPPLPDGTAVGTLALLGFVPSLGLVPNLGWDAFAASAEARDGQPAPLDRWSQRVIGALAAAVDGVALYPFGGPPWLAFQRWAMRAEPVFASPLGILLHPDWGLWHSYRGALALRGRLPLPDRAPVASPCESCVTQPCLSACPVGAFAPGRYDVPRCAAFAETADCASHGCQSRRACPVGAAHAYSVAQASFHMSPFLAAHR